MSPYVEPGGSWRPFWLVAVFLAALVVADAALPGPDVPASGWVVAVVAVLGVVGIGTVSARRVWTVRVLGEGFCDAARYSTLRITTATWLGLELALKVTTSGVAPEPPVNVPITTPPYRT